jgi:SNF2 family DNA or RNA helicase
MEERLLLETDFFKNSNFRILLVQFQVGAHGMNLQIANRNIFVDCWWNYARDFQALQRTHRPGQHKKVYCHRLIIKDSIERFMIYKTMEKKHLAESYTPLAFGDIFEKKTFKKNILGFDSYKEVIRKAFEKMEENVGSRSQVLDHVAKGCGYKIPT